MRPRQHSFATIPVLLLLGSCAYYNGLYNAKALARRAERAERDGRTFDAQSLWGQVAVKAETVLVRHPQSRWTEEARFLHGKALERGGDCAAAVPPLARLVREAREPRIADEAALRLSSCQARLGDLDAAGFASERLTNSPDPARRAEARWRTGVAYRRTGRVAEAAELLRTSGHPRARGELAAALADLGLTATALALSDSLLTERDSTVPWGAVIGGVGRQDGMAASGLIDRVRVRLAGLPPDTVATWLVNDGRRLLLIDEMRALRRYEEAYQAAPDRAIGVDARILALRHRLATSQDLRLFDTIPVLLGEIEPGAGEVRGRARQLVASALSIRARLDSLDVTAPQGDLRGFLLGEALRDSLHAPRLAVGVWRRILEGRPDTPYAPKLLLAIAGAEGSLGDSLTGLLAMRYADSPYVLALQGVDTPGYRALEDSLGRFARTLLTPARAPGRQPSRGVRPTPTTPAPAAPVQ